MEALTLPVLIIVTFIVIFIFVIGSMDLHLAYTDASSGYKSTVGVFSGIGITGALAAGIGIPSWIIQNGDSWSARKACIVTLTVLLFALLIGILAGFGINEAIHSRDLSDNQRETVKGIGFTVLIVTALGWIGTMVVYFKSDN